MAERTGLNVFSFSCLILPHRIIGHRNGTQMPSPIFNLGHSVFVMLNVDFGFLKRKIVIRFVCSDVRPLASQLNNFVVPSSPPPHIRSRPIYIISLRFHMAPISNLTL